MAHLVAQLQRSTRRRAGAPPLPAPTVAALTGHQHVVSNQAAQRRAASETAGSTLRGSPSRRVSAPDGGRPIDVFDTPSSRAAAARMGALAFAYRDSIFMGPELRLPGIPDRNEIVRHETAHVVQSRRPGPWADRAALEAEADGWRGGSSQLAADPDEAYGLLWIPIILVGGYILLKPNTANAPGPKSKVYKSMDTKDYFKMVGEAVVLGSGGLVASGLRKAGYSVITTWGVSGAYGSMGFRAVGDISSGSFSGIDAYVVDGITGATVGVVMGGTFHALGKVPGLSRVQNWFLRGAEGDEAYRALSSREKLLYEIGQKTLGSADEYAKVAHLSPVERGAMYVEQYGWLKSLFPSSPKFMPGTGGTFSTGPTPGGRWLFRSSMGFGAGATSNYLMGDFAREGWGVGMDAYGMSGMPGMPGFGPAPSGPGVIIVVPEGQELSYLIRSGQVGDFPIPDGATGLKDVPSELKPHGFEDPSADAMG